MHALPRQNNNSTKSCNKNGNLINQLKSVENDGPNSRLILFINRNKMLRNELILGQSIGTDLTNVSHCELEQSVKSPSYAQ